MKFRFPFETVMKHRKRIEEQAQRDYLLAKAEVDASLDRINALFMGIDQAREQIARLQMSGGPSAPAICQAEDFIIGQKQRIETERQRARELMQVAEQKHTTLIEASREFKVLENLKQRRFKIFKKEKKKHEAKEIDDLVTMRHKRG